VKRSMVKRSMGKGGMGDAEGRCCRNAP